MRQFLTTASVAIFAAFAPLAALAATILPQGVTTVEVTADLAGLGLGGAPLGSASVTLSPEGNPVFNFPITGGTADASGALIEHEGSGLQLFIQSFVALPFITGPNDAPSITAENFVIDTAAATVFGDVNGTLAGLPLFTFGDVDADGIDLLVTDTLAGALTDVFGAPDLTGAVFGIANTNPALAAIPLPAGGALLLGGLGLLALRRKV